MGRCLSQGLFLSGAFTWGFVTAHQFFLVKFLFPLELFYVLTVRAFCHPKIKKKKSPYLLSSASMIPFTLHLNPGPSGIRVQGSRRPSWFPVGRDSQQLQHRHLVTHRFPAGLEPHLSTAQKSHSRLRLLRGASLGSTDPPSRHPRAKAAPF